MHEKFSLALPAVIIMLYSDWVPTVLFFIVHFVSVFIYLANSFVSLLCVSAPHSLLCSTAPHHPFPHAPFVLKLFQSADADVVCVCVYVHACLHSCMSTSVRMCVMYVLLFSFLWFKLLVVIDIVIFCLWCLNLSVVNIWSMYSTLSSVFYFLSEVQTLQLFHY